MVRNISSFLGIGILGKLEGMLCGDLHDSIPSLGNAHHATDGGDISSGEVAHRHAVGGNHEVLDDLLGPVLFLHLQIADFVALKYRLGLNGLQAERALSMAKALHLLGGLILEQQILGQPLFGCHRLWHGRLSLQPGTHAIVGQLGMITYCRSVDVRVQERSVRAEWSSPLPWPGGPRSDSGR